MEMNVFLTSLDHGGWLRLSSPYVTSVRSVLVCAHDFPPRWRGSECMFPPLCIPCVRLRGAAPHARGALAQVQSIRARKHHLL